MVQIKKHRLNEKSMYDHIYKNKISFIDSPLSLNACYPESNSVSKIGFIIKKKTGSAVFRNKLKRILREVFFQEMPHFNRSCWILFEVNATPGHFSLLNFRKKAKRLLQNV